MIRLLWLRLLNAVAFDAKSRGPSYRRGWADCELAHRAYGLHGPTAPPIPREDECSP